MATIDSWLLAPGTDASKPTAGILGRIYPSTDTRILYYDNGTSWVAAWAASQSYRGAWVSGTSYQVGDQVLASSIMYVCILAVSGTTAPSADTTHWTGYPTGGGGGGITPYLCTRNFTYSSNGGSIAVGSWFRMSLFISTYANGQAQDDTDGSGHNLWDSSNYWYTCPVNGYYRIDGYAQFGYAGTPSTGDYVGLSVDTSDAAGNYPDYQYWVSGMPITSTNELVCKVNRVQYCTAGTQLRFCMFGSSSHVANVGMNARLTIMLVK